MSRPDAFRPGWLPASETYYGEQGIEMKGRGDWRSALCQFHDERNPSLRINIDTGAFFCNGCHAKGGDVLAFHMLKYGLSFVDAARDLGAWDEAKAHVLPASVAVSSPVVRIKPEKPHQPLGDHWRGFWDDLRPVEADGADYLQARACRLPPVDGDLRYHPALKHPSGYVGPALIALVTDAVTGEPLTLHKTWIQADGRKADIDKPRLFLTGYRKQGGVIRLWPDEAVDYGLVVGEGIESTLTLARIMAPAWACIDAGNLAAFPVLPGVESLTIAADHDPAGLKAAQTCADRWLDAGAAVKIVKSPTLGQDLNDFALEAVQ